MSASADRDDDSGAAAKMRLRALARDEIVVLLVAADVVSCDGTERRDGPIARSQHREHALEQLGRVPVAAVLDGGLDVRNDDGAIAFGVGRKAHDLSVTQQFESAELTVFDHRWRGALPQRVHLGFELIVGRLNQMTVIVEHDHRNLLHPVVPFENPLDLVGILDKVDVGEVDLVLIEPRFGSAAVAAPVSAVHRDAAIGRSCCFSCHTTTQHPNPSETSRDT